VHIGLVTQEFPPETAKGGIGTQSLAKAKGLTALGHSVRVISRSRNGQRCIDDSQGFEVIRVASSGLATYTELADWLDHSCAVAKEIANLHQEQPFDVLDFPDWGCEAYVHLLNQSDWNHIPTVIQLHGPLVMLAHAINWPALDSDFYRFGTQMEASCLRLADAVFSSSRCSADWCAREYGLERQSMEILHTGVDTQRFRPGLREKQARPTVIFVGTLVENKGVFELVEAVSRLLGEFPDLQLQVIGDGEQQVIERLRLMAKTCGLEDAVLWTGRLAVDELAERLCAAHVFAAPSFYEGGPGFVYLEAMACGLPVIGCDGSGAAEVIRHGHNGLLVPPRDPNTLAAALRSLLVDERKRAVMGEKARQFVLQHSDSSHCIMRIADYYRRVIHRSTGVHPRRLG
jgi:glycosyltransferase involved in cell wall biosynthesis